MPRRRWLLPLAALGAVIFYRSLPRDSLARISANIRAFSLPSATLYDILSSIFLEGFYTRVVGDIVAMHPVGSALDVGCGPGQVAVRLAKLAPGLTITGIDIAPAMIERATRRAASAGVADRVTFKVGDALALPFPDQQFDLVISTFSLHHWSDPAVGLKEAFRVLKQGGQACIYDIAGWLQTATRHGVGMAEAIAESPIVSGSVETLNWPGPVPGVTRVCLRRSSDA